MGLNNEHAHVTGHRNRPVLVFDIETFPMPDCAQYLTEPVEAPANYKDPVKIAAYVEDKRMRQVLEAGLDLDLCEIAAIGWWWSDGQRHHEGCVSRQTESESELLQDFWNVAAGSELIGFNCLHFDLPVLLRRSLYLNVPALSVSVDKYRHDGVSDIAEVLTFGGRMKWRSLAFYAKRFGISHDDSVKGDQIADLVAIGQWDKVCEHVKADVQTTRLLAERIGLIQPVATPEAVAL